MLRFLPIFAALSVFAALLSQTLEAAAQDATAPHPRRARAMYLSQDHPAVLLDDDRVWIPSGLDQPLSVCAGARCAPVDRSESCEAPDCPGVGARVILRSAIASIDGFPTGREGFEAETQAMRVDAVLTQLSGYFGSHPDGSGGGGSSDAEGFSLFGAFGGAIATFDGGGGAFAGGTGTIGLRFAIDGDDVWDSRMLETLFGDRFTLSLRGSYLLATRGQSGGFVTTIGGSFEAENRVDDSAFQVPALLGVIVPEMGALFRDDLRATFYARWAVPIKVCFSRSAGLEIRPSVTVTEAPTGGAESIIAVELGGFVQ